MNYRKLVQSLLSLKIVFAFSTLLLFLAILQITFGLEKHLRSGLIDFAVYYRYGQILLSGRSPYGPQYTSGIPFNYPPSSFMIFAPLSSLPFLSASVIFTAISFLSFIICTYTLLRVIFPRKPIRFLLLTLLIQNFPVKFTLVTGQVNLLVLSLLLLSFLFDQKKRPLLSGLLWGTACALKLTPITLGLFFLLQKKYSSLLSGLLLFAAANLFFLLSTPGSLFYFTSHLPHLLSKTGAITTLYDHSLRAFLARLGVSHNAFWSNIIVLILFCLIFLKLSQLSNLVFFSLILIVTTIGNSFAWQHHFVLTLPGFIAASAFIYRKKRLPYFLLTLSSAILVGMHFKDIAHPPTTNPFIISHALIGSLILFGLLLTQNHKNQKKNTTPVISNGI